MQDPANRSFGHAVDRYKAPEWRDGEVCLLMEYCDGGSVASLLGLYGAYPWRIVVR